VPILPFYFPIHHFINPSTYQLINLSTYQLINLSTYQLINLSTYQLINLSTYQKYIKMGWFSGTWLSPIPPWSFCFAVSLLTPAYQTDDSDQSRAYNDYNQGGVNQEHEASFTHELIAGAASYEAAKAYEKHCDENGESRTPVIRNDCPRN
jgi:hypothetical protein